MSPSATPGASLDGPVSLREKMESWLDIISKHYMLMFLILMSQLCSFPIRRPNGQLTAAISHLLDLQPCALLLGLAPLESTAFSRRTPGADPGLEMTPFSGVVERSED
jgi:hypothetical protein